MNESLSATGGSCVPECKGDGLPHTPLKHVLLCEWGGCNHELVSDLVAATTNSPMLLLELINLRRFEAVNALLRANCSVPPSSGTAALLIGAPDETVRMYAQTSEANLDAVMKGDSRSVVEYLLYTKHASRARLLLELGASASSDILYAALESDILCGDEALLLRDVIKRGESQFGAKVFSRDFLNAVRKSRGKTAAGQESAFTLLGFAIKFDSSLPTIRVLLDAKASVDKAVAEDAEMNWTPLLLACDGSRKPLETVQLLLEAKASCDKFLRRGDPKYSALTTCLAWKQDPKDAKQFDR